MKGNDGFDFGEWKLGDLVILGFMFIAYTVFVTWVFN